MRNKNKLRAQQVLIENDLTWEERKKQELINKWIRQEKEKDKGSKGRKRQSKSRQNVEVVGENRG